MEKVLDQCLHALLAREGLEPREGDLQEFARIIELYVENLKTLHSVNLDAEEVAGVFLISFRPRRKLARTLSSPKIEPRRKKGTLS